ncbi:transcriptional regulator, ArsR family [Thioalkalivibrio sulfidiphilus HL-EbGr7]|uniref:Transcriptional regulator, ArsR family n=1 Tax=Thioalkalivibrio sulfidiphilus (strain HL-EbGR7) TaxID=396588 RepID=B8GT27_THISH|nr:metalloregulator ArsR/SmtB family transcription factor [Thioalkalivibrio sulfidiphilus]ACL73042.1 transcriptional regulator, ArsR family [Thioalkalivibrio sulfidiphilus HL-EbGr7]
MSSTNIKHLLLAQFARLGKALSHPNRLELLEFLAQGSRGVDELAGLSGQSVANTSQHLQQLRQAGLVESRRQGQRVLYSLAGDDVIALMDALRRVARQHIPDVDHLVHRHLDPRDAMEPVPVDQLLERIRRGEVTVVDVRPEAEFQAGHVPGAINIPLDELEARLGQLDPGREVIAYCRGPYCVLAYDAVHNLREKGFRARRMEDGYPEWKNAGLPVEKAAS